jgi:hypothetical protein
MRWVGWCGLLVAASIAAAPGVADACGGCFAPPPPTPDRAQIVTDHRMVLSLSQRQTTLWDQIRYTGAPEGFVWVLPVANAAALRIGLADDNFVEALDEYTAPVVTANLPDCFTGRTTPRAAARGGVLLGCGASALEPSVPGAGGESTRVPRDGEAVVGPYAIEVVGTKAGGGQLDEWLVRHGFQIPNETRAAIQYYVDLQFDFVILRLAPGAGVHQMQPVRITTRGYAPALPLRMIAAGIGDSVGLTLMVIAESRVEAQGFDNVTIRREDLTFDYATGRSNWRDRWTEALRRSGRPTWVIESSQGLDERTFAYRVGWQTPHTADGGIVPLPDSGFTGLDGGTGFPDADAPWNDDDAGLPHDGHGAMEPTDGGGMAPSADPYVDRRVAFEGFSGRATVTRMRTLLETSDLERDLVLDASDAAPIPVEYVAHEMLNAPACPRGRACAVVGGAAPATFEVLLVVAIVRRWRRRRRAKREGAAA